MGIIKTRKIDCQDCGNPNCQKSDHTFTYEKYVKLKELEDVLDNFFELYGYTKLTEDAWAVLKLDIGFEDKTTTSIPRNTKDVAYP